MASSNPNLLFLQYFTMTKQISTYYPAVLLSQLIKDCYLIIGTWQNNEFAEVHSLEFILVPPGQQRNTCYNQEQAPRLRKGQRFAQHYQP